VALNDSDSDDEDASLTVETALDVAGAVIDGDSVSVVASCDASIERVESGDGGAVSVCTLAVALADRLAGAESIAVEDTVEIDRSVPGADNVAAGDALSPTVAVAGRDAVADELADKRAGSDADIVACAFADAEKAEVADAAEVAVTFALVPTLCVASSEAVARALDGALAVAAGVKLHGKLFAELTVAEIVKPAAAVTGAEAETRPLSAWLEESACVGDCDAVAAAVAEAVDENVPRTVGDGARVPLTEADSALLVLTVAVVVTRAPVKLASVDRDTDTAPDADLLAPGLVLALPDSEARPLKLGEELVLRRADGERVALADKDIFPESDAGNEIVASGDNDCDKV